MKKLLVVLCMITCMFGMTACSSDKEVEAPRKIELYAKQYGMSSEEFVGMVSQAQFDNVVMISENDMLEQYIMTYPDDTSMESAVASYENAIKDMGEITNIACNLPEHIVVPYRNIPKHLYPKNTQKESGN